MDFVRVFEGFMEKSHLDVAGKVVVVAIKATSKEVSKTALVWALTHVVQPGDHIKLLVVIPSHHSSKIPLKILSVFVDFLCPRRKFLMDKFSDTFRLHL